jgi:hypothetical protein
LKKTYLFLALLTFFYSASSIAQENKNLKKNAKFTAHNKGKFFVSWGGNRENYTKSDVRFRGKDYDFTIYDMVAQDKGKGYHVDYINPARMTIPQTNFRMGYFINDHYSIAIGWDHMKYVMTEDQIANVKGYIDLPASEVGSANNGSYNNVPVKLTTAFLEYEHTDGLNYVNTEFSRHDDISNLFKINNTDKIQINLTEGIGGGLLYPKTNTTLLGKSRHDDFHVSGYGVSLKTGINFTFFKYFYLQGELKGGYINMPDIRTTRSSEDRASQDFFFLQRIVSFGGIFKL